MAKDQAEGQQSMFNGKKRLGFFSFLKRLCTINKDKSTPEATVYTDKKGNEYSVETSHGRFKRFKNELETKKGIDGHQLTERELGYREGVIRTMGEQAGAYKRKNGIK